MVRNKLHWDANDAVGLSKQRNSYQSSPTFLCFESPTASFAPQCNLFRTMWLDPANGLLENCQSLELWHLINNYWMRLSMISWIIKTEVCVICRSWRLRQITQTRGFDNSWYHAKTESVNNCFAIHFSHNSSSETEAKRSAILFLRTLQGT